MNKMMGQTTYMVRCLGTHAGQPCRGMIDIPLAGKGVCPSCGAVRALTEYWSEHDRVRTKTPVQGLK